MTGSVIPEILIITLITTIHIVAILFLIVAVLLQSGKGAEISASFGGSSQTVFGSTGGANFFTKLTGTLAAIFMATSITLTIMGSGASKKSVFEGSSIPQSKSAPAAPAAPAAPVNGGAPAAAQAPAAPAAPAKK